MTHQNFIAGDFVLTKAKIDHLKISVTCHVIGLWRFAFSCIECPCPDVGSRGVAGDSIRKGWGCPTLDMAGSSHFQQSHHQAQPSTSATLWHLWENIVRKGKNTGQEERMKRETAEATPPSDKGE